MKKIRGKIIAVSTLVLSLVVLLQVETNLFSKLLDEINDNRNHYLPCEQLPTIDEVNKTVQDHKDVIEKIIKEVGKRYRDGDIKVTWDNGSAIEGDNSGSYFGVFWGETLKCPGKADIVFDYLSHSDRQIIEKTLDNSFFGIPYRGENH